MFFYISLYVIVKYDTSICTLHPSTIIVLHYMFPPYYKLPSFDCEIKHLNVILKKGLNVFLTILSYDRLYRAKTILHITYKVK